MAKFDFIESSTKAYRYVWENRADLARPSGFVLLVKFACFVVVLLMGLEQNLLRQGLVLLPSYFVEGWIIAHIMLKALCNEKERAYQIPARAPESVQRSIIMSMIIYVLLKLVLSLLIGLPALMGVDAMSPEAEPNQTSGALFLGALAFMAFIIWAFRLLWLYIPPALGFSVNDYMNKVKRFNSSYYMIGLWVLCFVPIGLVLLLASQVVSMPFDTSGDTLSTSHKYVLAFLQGSFDYAMVLVSSLGMAYGVASMFNKEDKTVSLF